MVPKSQTLATQLIYKRKKQNNYERVTHFADVSFWYSCELEISHVGMMRHPRSALKLLQVFVDGVPQLSLASTCVSDVQWTNLERCPQV